MAAATVDSTVDEATASLHETTGRTVIVASTKNGAICMMSRGDESEGGRGAQCSKKMPDSGVLYSYSHGGDSNQLVGVASHGVTSVSLSINESPVADLPVVDGVFAWSGDADAIQLDAVFANGTDAPTESIRTYTP